MKMKMKMKRKMNVTKKIIVTTFLSLFTSVFVLQTIFLNFALAGIDEIKAKASAESPHYNNYLEKMISKLDEERDVVTSKKASSQTNYYDTKPSTLQNFGGRWPTIQVALRKNAIASCRSRGEKYIPGWQFGHQNDNTGLPFIYGFVAPLLWDVVGELHNQVTRRVARLTLETIPKGIGNAFIGIKNLSANRIYAGKESEINKERAQLSFIKQTIDELVSIMQKKKDAKENMEYSSLIDAYPNLKILLSKVRTYSRKKAFTADQLIEQLEYFNRNYTEFKNSLKFESVDDIAKLVAKDNIATAMNVKLSPKEKLHKQIEKIKAKLSVLEMDIDNDLLAAKTALKSGKRRDAKNILIKKKFREKNYDAFMTKVTNLELLEDKVGLAQDNKSMIRILIESNKFLKDHVESKDAKNIDKIMDALSDHIADVDDISNELGRDISNGAGGGFDDELDEEVANLTKEVTGVDPRETTKAKTKEVSKPEIKSEEVTKPNVEIKEVIKSDVKNEEVKDQG
ncbi:MAG: Snf7 family protein [Oligoflexia bacterium]|nr:Snf7 family protein [Oligoflexia bacterium]